MNPEIKKFWEAAGKEIQSYDYDDSKVWIAQPDIAYYKQSGPYFWNNVVVCLHLKKSNIINYYFEGKNYTEQEMLKIIKLKAFV